MRAKSSVCLERNASCQGGISRFLFFAFAFSTRRSCLIPRFYRYLIGSPPTLHQASQWRANLRRGSSKISSKSSFTASHFHNVRWSAGYRIDLHRAPNNLEDTIPFHRSIRDSSVMADNSEIKSREKNSRRKRKRALGREGDGESKRQKPNGDALVVNGEHHSERKSKKNQRKKELSLQVNGTLESSETGSRLPAAQPTTQAFGDDGPASSEWTISKPLGGRMVDVDPILTRDEQYAVSSNLIPSELTTLPDISSSSTRPLSKSSQQPIPISCGVYLSTAYSLMRQT